MYQDLHAVKINKASTKWTLKLFPVFVDKVRIKKRANDSLKHKRVFSILFNLSRLFAQVVSIKLSVSEHTISP